jgi:hypothetical protein
MSLLKRIPVVTLFAVNLAGCATVVPKFDVPYYANGAPSTASITREIECELYDLIREDVPQEQQYQHQPTIKVHNYQVAMLLSLDVTDTGGLAPSGNFPINKLLSFNAAGELQQAREDSLALNLNYSLVDDLLHAPQAKKAQLATCPTTSPADGVDTNLAGNLGLKEKVTAALLTADKQGVTTAPTPTSGEFTGVINFTVTKNVNAVGPTWTLTHFKGPGNLLSLSEVNLDKLSFAFAEGKSPVALGAEGKKAAYVSAATNAGKVRAQNLLDRQLQIETTTDLSLIRSGL